MQTKTSENVDVPFFCATPSRGIDWNDIDKGKFKPEKSMAGGYFAVSIRGGRKQKSAVEGHR